MKPSTMFVDCLKCVVKLKLTVDLRDGAIAFLGRQIHRKSHDDSLIFSMADYYKEIFDGFGRRASVGQRFRQTSEICTIRMIQNLRLSFQTRLWQGFGQRLVG